MRTALLAPWLLTFSLLLVGTVPAFAVEPDEMLADPVLESRARAISQELRCLVCQNESIDDSQADLAHDLRVLVRQRLVDGDTDQQVLDFLTKRYGDFVLLMPPFKTTTLVLWLGPFAILLSGAVSIALLVRNRQRTTLIATEESGEADLNDGERRRLRQILAEDR